MLLFTLIQQVSEFSTSSEGREYAPPDSLLYYLVLIGSSIIVLGVVIFAVKWFVWPGEQSEDHIKRKILKDES
ncbi:hypothetical protein G3569_10195 [Aliifodinibius halophilus]|uniref:Uncharacterized protein n=2 Tax=Fodinibius halophilus TaxID=1736908 RepID=A0A6M1T3S4_9BACT|nr:hypothetical protein [Fodinibius halophilus]